MLSTARATITHRAADDVARAVPQRLPEHGQVMGHEVGRDRDRDHVVEHLPPGGDEADQLVEGVAGEARGAAGLGEHHRRLGIGGRRGGEDQPGDDEGDRRQAERKGSGDPERVVDRRADVAVGGRKQRADAMDAAQRFVAGDSLGHQGWSRCRCEDMCLGRQVPRPVGSPSWAYVQSLLSGRSDSRARHHRCVWAFAEMVSFIAACAYAQHRAPSRPQPFVPHYLPGRDLGLVRATPLRLLIHSTIDSGVRLRG